MSDKGTFRDFIPEGEETGAQGAGYTDFVPSAGEPTTPVPTTDADVEKWSDAKPVAEEPKAPPSIHLKLGKKIGKKAKVK